MILSKGNTMGKRYLPLEESHVRLQLLLHDCCSMKVSASTFFFVFTLFTGPRKSLSLTLNDTSVYET